MATGITLGGNGLPFREREGGADAVDGGGDDAAGVACAFTTRINAGHTDVFEGFDVARNAYGRRSATFDSQKERLVSVVPSDFHFRKGLLKSGGDHRRKGQMKRCAHDAGVIGCARQALRKTSLA